jgi:uncharacterized protein YgiM (DUF1202 family)
MKKNRNKRSFGDKVRDLYYDIKDWCVDHGRIVLPLILAVCILAACAVGLLLHRNVQNKNLNASDASDAATSGAVETPLEKNAYPDVDALIKKYFDATADGDVDTISTITTGLSDDEKLRIKVIGDYIDAYTSVDVYTKPGPQENSYVCYAVTKVKFTGNDTEIPGMQTMYVTTGDGGALVINENEQNTTDTEYIKKVSLDADVVDLNNKVTAEYNDLTAANTDLSDFVSDLSSKIDVSVGEALASASSSGSSAESASTTVSDAASAAASAAYLTAKGDDINIRASASQDADVLGKAGAGDSFKLLETDGDWSKIEYNGSEGYVKTEFFTASTGTAGSTGSEKGDSSGENSSDGSGTSADSKSGSSASSSGTSTDSKSGSSTGSSESSGTASSKATVKEAVAVRSSASTDSDKLGTVYAGSSLNVIMKMEDGWTKVSYNGKTGYVKTEFLTFK